MLETTPAMRQACFEEIDKIATSKWREKIRSGELHGAKAQRLMGDMGWTTERALGGLEKGTEGIAKKHGYTISRPETGMPRTVPLAKKMVLPKNMPIIASPEGHRAVNAVFGRHEADEAIAAERAKKRTVKKFQQAAKKKGIVAKAKAAKKALGPMSEGYRSPTRAGEQLGALVGTFAGKRTGRAVSALPTITATQHMHGDVLTKEMRNLRMIPEGSGGGEGRRKVKDIRRGTREFRDIQKATGGSMQIPKRKSRSIGRQAMRIGEEGMKRSQERVTQDITKFRRKLPGKVLKFLASRGRRF